MHIRNAVRFLLFGYFFNPDKGLQKGCPGFAKNLAVHQK